MDQSRSHGRWRISKLLIVQILGSGTSQGVPVVACKCATCLSTDPKDKRLRSSILIKTDSGSNLIVDAGPDLRQQLLHAEVEMAEAVFLTHEHIDHVNGIDDLRPLIFRSGKEMPLYGTKHVLGQVRERFAYAFARKPYPGAPRLELRELPIDGSFDLGGARFQSLEVFHGDLQVAGLKVNRFAYVTDALTVPAETMEQLQDLDVLIVNALRHRPHYSHLNLEQALELIAELNPKRAYLTHLSHEFEPHLELSELLPENVHVAYDGLTIDLA